METPNTIINKLSGDTPTDSKPSPTPTPAQSPVTLGELMEKVQAAGYSGIKLWGMGKQYMACLTAPPPSMEPLYNTNLWNYTNTAEEAVQKIADKATRNPYQG